MITRRRRLGVEGFTMVEVALSLGVIAIALVAIIGILPTGLQVQRENRQDTLLNQDGLILVEAIRNGREVGDRRRPVTTRFADWPTGLDYLTNHVLAVAVTNAVDGAVMYLNPLLVPEGRLSPFGELGRDYLTRPILTNGLHVVGLLSRPRTEAREGVVVTNYVAALMRSISGPATDQGTVGRDLAFTYVVTSELSPLGNAPRSWVDYGEAGLLPEQILVRSNRFMQALNQGGNFSELRFRMAGPAIEVTENDERRWVVYSRPKLLRTVLSGRHFSYQVHDDPGFVVSYLLTDGYQRLTP